MSLPTYNGFYFYIRDTKGKLFFSNIAIGDYVNVIDAGSQISGDSIFSKYFFNSQNAGYIEHNYADWKPLEPNKLYKVMGMISSDDRLVYHLKSRDGKNYVVTNRGVKKSNFHTRNRTPYTLPSYEFKILHLDDIRRNLIDRCVNRLDET